MMPSPYPKKVNYKNTCTSSHRCTQNGMKRIVLNDLTRKASLSGSTSCMYRSLSKFRVSETYSASGGGGSGGVSGWLKAYFGLGLGPALTLRVSENIGKNICSLHI